MGGASKRARLLARMGGAVGAQSVSLFKFIAGREVMDNRSDIVNMSSVMMDLFFIFYLIDCLLDCFTYWLLDLD